MNSLCRRTVRSLVTRAITIRFLAASPSSSQQQRSQPHCRSRDRPQPRRSRPRSSRPKLHTNTGWRPSGYECSRTNSNGSSAQPPMKLGEAQTDKTPKSSPAQKAIATAIDGHTDKNLGIQKLPGSILEQARDAALHSGPPASSSLWPIRAIRVAAIGAGICRRGRQKRRREASEKSADRLELERMGTANRGARTRRCRGQARQSSLELGSHVTFVENYTQRQGLLPASAAIKATCAPNSESQISNLERPRSNGRHIAAQH